MDSAIITDEVVISGISGSFPYSNNIDELRDNLFKKANLLSSEDCRWNIAENPDVPSSTGKIGNLHKFDSFHFGMHRKLTESIDPLMYIILEKSYEAVMDAGINPNSLKGSKTSVVMNLSFSESDDVFDYAGTSDGFGIMGHCRSMLATRVAYYLDVRGPVYTILTGWAGGINALTHAYLSIRTGLCSTAIVGACNFSAFPHLSRLYNKLGLLSPDGLTRSFDASGNGYGRSDAAVVLILQNKRDAKRIYAEVLHSDVFNYGIRENFVIPSQLGFKKHLKKFYKTCQVNPAEVQYLEADGSACHKNDIMELNAVAEVMTRNRKTPLLIGSIKSNIGHTESTAGMSAITKVVIAMESGYIPPNLHYDTPVPGVPALKDGRLKVVTEKVPWAGGLAAINCMGIDGNCSHVLLRSHSKKKSPKTDLLPRLVTVSSRTEEGVNKILSQIEAMPTDPEFIRLLHDIHEINIPTHLYRGYTIVGSETKATHEVQHFEGVQRPVWFIFSGMGSQWPGMATHLLQLPVFAEAIDRCHTILETKGLDLKKIITDKDPQILENTLNSFVGISAVQIGLIAVMQKLGIEPDGIIGHSLGELACGLADGCFTEEEMILCAYYRGKASLETNLILGMMAAVGLGHKKLIPLLPPEIDIACYNGPESCTITGPANDMKVFVEALTNKGIFARLVNASNIAFHSRYIAPVGPHLLKYLKQALPNLKKRSERWICTSVQEKDWNSPSCQYSCPEYYTNNLLSPVYFEDGCNYIPKNAICIEIAPHGLLQAILRRSLDPSCTNISLTQRGHEQGLHFFLQAIGKLYMYGLQPKLSEIFPHVSFPVSRGTPSISPLVEWEHSDFWPIINCLENNLTSGETKVQLSLTQRDTRVYRDHVLGGHATLPAVAHLKLAWTILTTILNKNPEEMNVVFENVIFHQPVFIPKQGSIQLHVLVQRGSGMFEVLLDNMAVTTGQIILPEDVKKEFTLEISDPTTSWTELSKEDVYKELSNRGYKHAGVFQAITSARISQTCTAAKIEWSNNWVAFTDCLLQLAILQTHEDSQDLRYPTFLRRFIVNMNLQDMKLEEELEAVVHHTTNIICCRGMELHGLQTRPIDVNCDKNLQIYQQRFVSHEKSSFKDLHEFIEASLHLALENYHPSNKNTSHVTVAELKNKHSLLSVVENTTKNILNTWVETETIVRPDEGELKKNCILLMTNETLVKEGKRLIGNSGAFLLVIVPDSIIWQPDEGLVVIMVHACEGYHLYLLRKEIYVGSSTDIILIEEKKATWLRDIQAVSHKNTRIYLVSNKEPLCGIPSFLKKLEKDCSIRNIRCFFILDNTAPTFSLSDKFYQKQLIQDLSLNVYTKGQWGTYRALSLIEKTEKRIRIPVVPFSLEEIDIHYMGITDPELTEEVGSETKNDTDFEYSGVDYKGERLMGFLLHKPMKEPFQLSWTIPSSWSFEEAATVPKTYALAYYIFKLLANVHAEDQVLIHMGHTVVSQAAIHVALSLGMTVFTSAASEKQRQIIEQLFPQLTNNQILNAESTKFEHQLLRATKGKGVSLVISALSGEKMLASLRCLKLFGLMIQLGKETLNKLNHIGMSSFMKGISLHGVSTEKLQRISPNQKKQLHEIVQNGITSGAVKPLGRIVCVHHDLDRTKQLLDDLSFSKKILVNIKSEEREKQFHKHGTLHCNPQSSYLIFGGKGDDWLNLAVWLVKRGARKLVIAQQSQPITSYLARQVGLLRTCHGVDIRLLSAHIAFSPLGASSLINEANSSGPLAAIFILPLQNREAAENSEWYSSTLQAVTNLDIASRSIPLQQFVCLQCQGVERVFENRHQLEFPALALQCGNHSKAETNLGHILLKMDYLLTTVKEPVVIVNAIQQKTDSGFSLTTADRLNCLLTTSIRDMIDLGQSLNEETEAFEVPSLSPGQDLATESIPIFLLPNLQFSSQASLKQLLDRLMSPTFILKPGKKAASLQEYATHLLQHVRKIYPKGPYILIGDLWGGAVAMELGQQLESQGHCTQIFLLDGDPENLQKTIAQLGQGNQFEVNLLTKLFNITSDKFKEELLNFPHWESKLNAILNTIPLEDDTERSLVKTAANTLYSHIGNLLNYKPSYQIESPVTLLLPNGSEVDNCGLVKFCKQTVNIHLVGEDHMKMLTSPETSDIINNNLL